MVVIDGAITVPEDEGTGVPEGEADWTSAGHVSGLQSRNSSGYVESGLNFTVDHVDNVLDISSGLARVFHSGTVQVQDANGDYNQDWDDGLVLAAALPAVTGISLTSDFVNYIYLSLDLTDNNRAEYITNTSGDEPASPSILLGLVDTTEETSHETYRSGPQSQHSIRPATVFIERGEKLDIPEDQGDIIAGPLEGEGTISGEGRLKVI